MGAVGHVQNSGRYQLRGRGELGPTGNRRDSQTNLALQVLLALLATALLGGSCSSDDATAIDEDTDVAEVQDADRPSTEPEMTLVFDASGSMGFPIGDRTRYDVARDAFNGLMADMESETRFGLLMMPGGCFASLRPLPPQPLVIDIKDQLIDLVAASEVLPLDPATAGPPATPIGAGLEAAAQSLSPDSVSRTIVLVSDGEEGCGNPPCEVAESLIDRGFEVTVETVGFQISAEGAKQLRCVANATGGTYRDVQDAAELSAALKTAAGQDSNQLVRFMFVLFFAVFVALAIFLFWKRRGQEQAGERSS